MAWLVKGIMYEAIEEKAMINIHPARNRKKVLPSQQVQQ